MTVIAFVVPGQPQGKVLQRIAERATAQGECWVPSLKGDRKGYVRCRVEGRSLFVHRMAYEAVNGPITPGMTIDHLCRNPACFNPSHLEQVSVRENIRRGTQGQYQRMKTHCPHGHPYAGANLYVSPSGERLCRTCQRANQRNCDRKRGRRYAQ